jgi:hypothetical protein
MPRVRQVRQNPYPQVSILPGVQHGCHSPVQSAFRVVQDHPAHIPRPAIVPARLAASRAQVCAQIGLLSRGFRAAAVAIKAVLPSALVASTSPDSATTSRPEHSRVDMATCVRIAVSGASVCARILARSAGNGSVMSALRHPKGNKSSATLLRLARLVDVRYRGPEHCLKFYSPPGSEQLRAAESGKLPMI